MGNRGYLICQASTFRQQIKNHDCERKRMRDFIQYFAVGATGAGAFELLKAYELRGKLDDEVFQRLFRSRVFWLVIAGMLLASGFLTWAFYAESDVKPTPWELVIAGIACRSLIRSAVEARVANAPNKLGEEAPPSGVGVAKVDFRDVFR
jgi:hypothetical protein